MAAPRRKGKKPAKFFVIAAEMRPLKFRADQFFIHAELVGKPDRLQAEDYFLTKMREKYPEHTVGMMTVELLSEQQEDAIIDHVSRRRRAGLKIGHIPVNGEAVI